MLSPIRDPARGKGDEGAEEEVGHSTLTMTATATATGDRNRTVDREPGPEAGDSTRARWCHERRVHHTQAIACTNNTTLCRWTDNAG